jgi:choline kinase
LTATNSVPHTAVILAAGLGSRLGHRGTARPKGFISFDDGVPIIEQSIRKMRSIGIARVVIVTGHLSHYYETLRGVHAGAVELIHNPQYAESGSMYSLYQARDLVRDDFWLFESDLVYERRALEQLALVPSGSALLMSGPTGSGDEVYVEAPKGYLHQLSKNRSILVQVHGELVGITRVSAECYDEMQRYAQGVFATGDLRLEYEQALVAAARKVEVRCPLVPDLMWSEIDTEAHWTRVREEVYPEIIKREAHA